MAKMPKTATAAKRGLTLGNLNNFPFRLHDILGITTFSPVFPICLAPDSYILSHAVWGVKVVQTDSL